MPCSITPHDFRAVRNRHQCRFHAGSLCGLTNVVFTILALLLIDRLGRRVLLSAGLAGIALSMLTLAYGFSTATYQLDQAIASLPAEMNRPALEALADSTCFSDLEFREAVSLALGSEQFAAFQAQLTGAAIQLNPVLILTAILAFVASFAVSIGPVMWVLFSELFPNRLRGEAISFAGLINSSILSLSLFYFRGNWKLWGLPAHS